MDFIKKFFEEFKTPPESKVEYTIRDVDFGEAFWKITDSRLEDAYFTQAEKQQLQAFVSDRLFQLENLKAYNKLQARTLKSKGYKDSSEVYYQEVEKTQKKINSLAKLQKKIKHTLATRG